ncbi:50S ribosomal protein L6 [Brackiella oedipodis]|uniref:50S ribosomal protein L6 n=1 Tax=Brackiella oedipodis TaxID=124225 RepID=UPI000490966C|nr:50S ribosomal protein L6 [Brackiella oedipodis]
MSRVASYPVAVPSGVEVKIDDNNIHVKGPLGELNQPLIGEVDVKLEDGKLTFASKSESKFSRAMSGTTRALVNNMVIGVSKGFERRLNLIGVGYRAQVQGTNLKLDLGYSHDILHPIPEGVKAECPTPTEVVIKGYDKQAVGQTAAKIREYRPPEPYKGKGVRYSDERVVMKEVKKK